MGEPAVLDAAQFGSCAHRLRNFWCNLVSPSDMQALCKVVVRNLNLLAAAALEPGREPAVVSSSDRPPYYPCNLRGQPRAAFPTIMAFKRSSNTHPGKPGAIKVTAAGESDEYAVAPVRAGQRCAQQASVVRRAARPGFAATPPLP